MSDNNQAREKARKVIGSFVTEFAEWADLEPLDESELQIRLEEFVMANVAAHDTELETLVTEYELSINDVVRQREDLKAKLALSSPAPVWSRERPKVPGWYWYLPKYDGGKARMVEVRDAGYLYVMDFGIEKVEHMNGQWSGPLEPPQDGGEV